MLIKNTCIPNELFNVICPFPEICTDTFIITGLDIGGALIIIIFIGSMNAQTLDYYIPSNKFYKIETEGLKLARNYN